MTNTPDSPKIKDNINGILLVNKAQGLSSNGVLQRAKHLLGAKKAGHTGSLDPLATGMLPICFGEATKLSQYILDADKAYTTTGLLGIKTNSADSTGEVVAQVYDFTVTEAELRSALSEFLGKIKQVPSMFSALKHQGTPLYKLARKGVEIERTAREITIYDLRLDAFDGKQFQMTVRCSKGTYIRNLVEDIGARLGVGAHVTQLHRLYTAGFSADSMITLEDLNELSLDERRALLLPMQRAIEHLSCVSLTSEQSLHLRQGQVVNLERGSEQSDIVQLYENGTCYIGLGEWSSSCELKGKRLLSFPSRN